MSPKFTLSLTAGICLSVLTSSTRTTSERIPHATTGKTRPVERRHQGYSSPRNNNAVKIYPDIVKRTMHVVAKENDGIEIDFFVFDLQGVLLKHYRMEEGDHHRITGLKRGKYIYHVFSGDEETATGKFEIR
ncbi:MAG TPA: T9SS type A sorting domain-containing protein [Chitinophagaceae bacterium]|nr:T9SS type A sorting domain-containing protein [Chitinophagaceae bacterium]HUM67083.1 T9SS type A sorting domain-containing protein [Chitinophagaceae bacterium]